MFKRLENLNKIIFALSEGELTYVSEQFGQFLATANNPSLQNKIPVPADSLDKWITFLREIHQLEFIVVLENIDNYIDDPKEKAIYTFQAGEYLHHDDFYDLVQLKATYFLTEKFDDEVFCKVLDNLFKEKFSKTLPSIDQVPDPQVDKPTPLTKRSFFTKFKESLLIVTVYGIVYLLFDFFFHIRWKYSYWKINLLDVHFFVISTSFLLLIILIYFFRKRKKQIQKYNKFVFPILMVILIIYAFLYQAVTIPVYRNYGYTQHYPYPNRRILVKGFDTLPDTHKTINDSINNWVRYEDDNKEFRKKLTVFFDEQEMIVAETLIIIGRIILIVLTFSIIYLLLYKYQIFPLSEKSTTQASK